MSIRMHLNCIVIDMLLALKNQSPSPWYLKNFSKYIDSKEDVAFALRNAKRKSCISVRLFYFYNIEGLAIRCLNHL